MEQPTSPIESSINHSKNLILTNTIQQSPKHWDIPNPSITTHHSCEDTLLFNGKLPPQHSTNNQTTTESTQNQSFIHTIYNLCRSISKLKETTNNNKILFIFETSMDAAVHNANVLESYNFNLDCALQAQKNTILYYGSEFKNTSELEPILSDHPLWKYTKETLENGAKFPLDPIDDESRKSDNNFHLSRGNHKSALDNKSILSELLNEDVSRAFALILPIQLHKYLPKISIAPLGCPKQGTINEKGERIFKHRMTHDQSFPGPSTLSVNKRVIQNLLPPSNVYGFAFKRIIHYIIKLRNDNPTTKIYISKFDFDAAFRRCHLSAATSLESCTAHDNFLYLHLRLTFGGSPCPSIWNTIAEPITDIANRLITCPDWDHKLFHDPLLELIKNAKSLPDTHLYAKAKELAINIPPNNIGKIDIYIDDNISISLDKDENTLRTNTAMLTAIRAISRPIDSSEEIPRKDIISLKKFQAEGTPSETKTVLGWLLNTRSLRIYLPDHKYTAWKEDISAIITCEKVQETSLEQMIGRLNHVACIMEMLRHFLGRLYKALYRAKKRGFTRLTPPEKEDLTIFQQFIQHASHKGISMNNLVYRKPTHTIRSDSSLFGLGGYNTITGEAWRIELPLDCRLRTSLNSLEFLAAMISIWIENYNNNIPTESCILSQTDSTSAAGWLKKSNFCDLTDEVVQLYTARKLASIMIDSDSCLYSQWFKGEENIIADALSRDFHLPDAELTFLIVHSLPHQVPPGFKITTVPPEIYSWLTCLLRNQPSTQQWSQEPIRSKLWLGQGIAPTSNPLGLEMITTLNNSANLKNTESLQHLQMQSDQTASTPEKRSQTNLNIVNPPSVAWHRPTDWLATKTQPLMQIENLHSFYNDSSDIMLAQTDLQSSKQQ
jgi:hypothetical protein